MKPEKKGGPAGKKAGQPQRPTGVKKFSKPGQQAAGGKPGFKKPFSKPGSKDAPKARPEGKEDHKMTK